MARIPSHLRAFNQVNSKFSSPRSSTAAGGSRPPNKTRYLKGIEELLKSIDEFSGKLPIVMGLVRFGGESLDDMAIEFRSIDIPQKTKSDIKEAWRIDDKTLRTELKSESIRNHWLADQLETKANPLSVAPNGIGRYVTDFDMINFPWKHKGRGNIRVFPVTFCDKEFVVKTRHIMYKEEEQEDIELQGEAGFMKLCRHPYAVALLGFGEAAKTDGPRVPLLLMESMEHDLDFIIKRNKRWWWGGTRGFPALDAIKFLLPVAKVMKYLHEIGVVHLDLKPKNILCARVPGKWDHPEDVSVKLADFGEARMAEDGVITPTGPRGYMDPDVFAKKGCVDLVKADVFSFGMVFGEVLTGLSPMKALSCKGLHSREFYKKIRKGEQIPLPEETPKFVKSILESCMKLNPAERPSFDDIFWKLQNTKFLLLNGCTCEHSPTSTS